MTEQPSNSTRDPRRITRQAIRRGIATTIAGTLLPALAALFCIRWMIQGLGTARFGILALAWAFVNSAGLLDLGVGRALTRAVALRQESDSRKEGEVLWTSLATIFAVGAVAGLIAWFAAGPLAGLLARNADYLVLETKAALRVLAFSVPLVVLASGLRGILEGMGRFDLINRVGIPVSLLNLVVPVLLLRVNAGLPAIVTALVLVRLGATMVLLAYCTRTLDSMRRFGLTARGLRSIAGFAGWVSVSSATGPLFVQGERFLLAAIDSPSAVAYYSTPADLLTRLTIIPGAMLQVLFPVLAQSMGSEPGRASAIFRQGSLSVLVSTMPLAILVGAVAPEGLELWLGPSVAQHATTPARLLAAAVFANCMAWLPFSMLQGAGLAASTGRVHLAEIPVHFALTAVLIRLIGVDGAATASLVRSLGDALIMGWLASRLVPGGKEIALKVGILVGASCGMMLLVSVPLGLPIRGGLAAIGSVLLVAIGWFWLLDGAGRANLSQEVRFGWGRVGGGRV